MPYEKRRPEMPPKRKPKGHTDDDDDDHTSSDHEQQRPPAKKAALTPRDKAKCKTPRSLFSSRSTIFDRGVAASTPQSSTPTTNDDLKPVIGAHKKGRGGGHNCPSKDAATTHQFCNRCFRQEHGGYCPSCNSVVSFKYGCNQHGWKKEALSCEPWAEFKGPVWDPENVEARHERQRGQHLHA